MELIGIKLDSTSKYSIRQSKYTYGLSNYALSVPWPELRSLD